MKIEMNTIYHLPTQAHEDDFLKQAEKQGLPWWGNLGNATCFKSRRNANSCVRVSENRLAGYDLKSFYKREYPQLPIIEWKLGFTKKDMQIGQAYKMINRQIQDWIQYDFNTYDDDLTIDNGFHPCNIVEVYPFPLTPIWKRPEPKYRAKTELTKEQAEKLGLEFCEEAKDERH